MSSIFLPSTRISQPVGLADIPGYAKAFLSPENLKIGGPVKTGNPAEKATPHGIGYYFGPGNYFSKSGLILSGVGAGSEPQYNCVEHITFVVTSNAAQDALRSIGTTPTDGGPLQVLQNNSGSLRLYLHGTYYAIGAAIVGRLHTVSITYSDLSPYPNKIYLDGALVSTINSYRYQYSGKTLYIGSGYPSQTANAVMLQYYLEQPGNWSDQQIKNHADNPFGVFVKSKNSIWFDMGAASGGAAVLEGNASGATSASGALTTGIPIAGAALSVASASGTLAVGIPLAGAAASMSTASGSLTAQITLAGSALAQAVSNALLSSGITMTAAAVAQAAADGTLVTAIQLLGGAQAQAGASGSLTTSTGGLEGNAQASASASASLSTQIRLSGAAIATAGASGNLGGSANLAGTAVSTASASGELTVNIALTAQALARAIASGSLTAQIRLDADAAAQAQAGAALSGGAGFVLPAARSRTVISTARRPAALSTSRR